MQDCRLEGRTKKTGAVNGPRFFHPQPPPLVEEKKVDNENQKQKLSRMTGFVRAFGLAVFWDEGQNRLMGESNGAG